MPFLRRRNRRRKPDLEVEGPGSPTDAVAALVDREWHRLADPGMWFRGEERVAIAAEARAAVHGRPPTGMLPDAATEAARRVAVEPAGIRADDVDRWADDGLDGVAYVELIGIVSRLAALDVTAFGLGWEERALPTPIEGEPARQRNDAAERTNGWVPTVGPATAPSSLSAVPPEQEAMFDTHGVLYLSLDEMGDLEIVRDDLARPQVELVAARTSLLNDCFY